MTTSPTPATPSPAKLTANERALILLYTRSTKDADGWANVSAMLWPLMANIRADFMERDGDSTNGGRARLTETGKTILQYAI